ncbi:hypothetical protein GCM10007421_17450 [Halopseudomonas oceani]|nr:hypothetical protein GCM10007421_17450 [Halopseudomonas oceani]
MIFLALRPSVATRLSLLAINTRRFSDPAGLEAIEGCLGALREFAPVTEEQTMRSEVRAGKPSSAVGFT